MNASPLTELFADFAASSWRAAWLIALLVGLRRVVRGRIPAGVWFVVWIIVALRLLIPFSVPVGWSPYNLTAPRAPAIERAPIPVSDLAPVPPAELNETPSAPGALVAPSAAEPARWTTGDAIAIGWLAGAVGLILLRASAAWRFRRRLHGARDADERVRAIARREAAGWRITRDIHCVETDAVDAPALFGLLRPWLLFPRGFAAQLNDDELRLVVRHELAHWRRRDLPAQALMQAAVALHWFNPLAWLAARLARADCELACDEFVLRRETAGGATAYGAALLKVLGVMRGRRCPGTVVAILEGKQQLAHRVRMIAGYQGSTAGRVCGGVLLVAVLAAASVTRESHAQEKPPAVAAAPIPASAPVAEPVTPTDSDREQRERHQRQAKAVEMLQATVDERRKMVDALAQQLQAFKEKNKTVSLDRRRDIVSNLLKETNVEFQRAGIALQTIETRLNQIRDYRARGADLTSLPFIASQPLIAELLQQLAAQRIAIAKLRETYREAHPNLVGAKNSFDQTQHELERAIKSVCDQVEAEHQTALKNFQMRHQDLEKNKAEALELDRLGVEYAQIEREFLTQNQILQNIVARFREETLVRESGHRAATSAPEPPTATPARPNAEPLSVVFQKRSSGWVLTETRGDQDELAKSTEQIQTLKATLAAPVVRSAPSAAERADEFSVSVLGAVNAQGAVTLLAQDKPIALDAVARAGGFAPNADRTAVRLIRADASGASTTTVLAEDALMGGGALLQPRDILVVPATAVPIPGYATVMGAVNRAGRIELPIGSPISIVDVISLAGGHSRLANLKQVKLSRRDAKTGSLAITSIDVEAFLKGTPNGEAPPTIAPDDKIFVPERIL